MEKKIITFLTFISNLLFCYSQQQFNYHFYINDNVRETTLFYLPDDDSAVFIDKLSTEKKSIKNNIDYESYANISFNGDDDFIFIKKDNNVLFNYNLLGNDYIVDDNLPKIEWELFSEKKLINQLNCYKAIAKFRGRTWTAWYTPDIPVNYGPWKFYGLPGLLIEIKDQTNNYGLTLIDYNLNSKANIPKLSILNAKKVSMHEMDIITDESYENLLHSDSGSKLDDTSVVLAKSLSTEESKRFGIEAYYEWEEEHNNN